ncbi:pyridoxal phosphate-dependent aminotransferase [Celerinatantimonas sp. YJH-8]|uniref:pyridoxal phosphate-dependent aminotransferase n=1 Tax=Celerinatantimonas sp. YJH-8 TaxID=3228714 RepID=UPI0038C4D693
MLSLINPIAKQLEESSIRAVANYGMTQPDVIPLWFGESNQPTPEFIRQAAADSLLRAETKYTPNTGIPELRRAIANYQSQLFSVPIHADNIAVTVSGTNAVMVACQTCLSAGDKVVAIEPIFPTLTAIPTLLGCKVTTVALSTDGNRFTLDLNRLFDELKDAKAFIINSPSNPTGWTASLELLEQILTFCREHKIWIISDEVYSRHVFDQRAAPSFCQLINEEDLVIVCNSFSKAWAMTGWRLGWLNVPRPLEPIVRKLQEFNMSCASGFSQAGGLAAIKNGENYVRESVQALHQSSQMVEHILGNIDGLTLFERPATFYAFLHLERLPANSQPFLRQMIDEVKVGAAPGEAFGKAGEGCIRICHAAPLDTLEVALSRMREFILRWQKNN